MRKHFLIPILALLWNTVQSQTRGIGYIDMEYILQKIPNYATSVQLE
jgi:Skp family chaperone for outer membrane proteins